MEQTLKKIVSGNLFEASNLLLSKLNIKHTQEEPTAMHFQDYYENQVPHYIENALQLTTACYYIGEVCDDAIHGVVDADTKLAEDLEKLRANAHYQSMMLFAVDLRMDSNVTRTDLAVLTRAFNRLVYNFPVTVIFRQDHLLSIGTCERTEFKQEWRQGQGEKLGKVSLLRNVDCLKPHRGHLMILESIGDKTYPTFDDLYNNWQQVFSSELLTKKFYSELSDWYAWAVQVARFPNDLSTTADDEKFNHESCIRLITRLIFVWFLKQKHLIPEAFFDERYIHDHFIENFNPHDRENLLYNPEKSRYYRLILQNLFFAMLNRPIVPEGKDKPNNRQFRGDRQFGYKREGYNVNNLMRYKGDFKEGGADEFLKIANSSVPFLNGGLFDCLDDKPKNLYYDGFSERKESLEQLYLPDWLFFGEEVGKGIDLSQWYDDAKKRNVSARGIIDILKRYNFTIEENTPLDQEVSLDPELLGKAFENLLASYNPETKTSARKQTGSFYTPREIVQYMVDESLVAHLKRICGDELEPQYRSLLSYATEETMLNEVQRRSIMQAIYNCRVLDPACGSGAFPMGVLQQMVHVLRQLDPTNEMWKDFMIDIAIDQSRKAFNAEEEEERKVRLADIEEAFNRDVNDPDYARKLYLIEHCIYGVDIQPIAVQISKLRFFISLVVDQNPTDDAVHNFGIRPLPNLESKFVAANTLIPVEYDTSFYENREDIRSYKDKLKELNHAIFLAKRNVDKQRLKGEIKATRKALAEAIEDTGYVNPGAAQKLADWDMFEQNTHADFFDAEWMFGVKGGFDIVIGNPPYVQLQANNGELAKLYKPFNYKSFAGRGDVYCLFYESSFNKLSEKGVLCFITSDKWMRSNYGKGLKQFLIDNTYIESLLDFTGVQIFENATVETNIAFIRNTKSSSPTRCTILSNNIKKEQLDSLYSYSTSNSVPMFFSGTDSWSILTAEEVSLQEKIRESGPTLKEQGISVNFGQKTGLNDAFIISSDVRKAILSQCKSTDEYKKTNALIKPVLRGRDIKKYYTPPTSDYIILAYNGIYKVIHEEYPALYSHLVKYEKELRNRGQCTDSSDSITNISKEYSGQHHWLELDNNPSLEKLNEYAQKNLLWKRIGSILRFSYSADFVVSLDSTCYAIGNNIKYLCCVLNSKMGNYILGQTAPRTGTGDLLISVQAINPIRVPIPAYDTKKQLEELLDKQSVEYTDEIQAIIDRLVYHLYGLTYDQVLIIDPTPPFTREEYEKEEK